MSSIIRLSFERRVPRRRSCPLGAAERPHEEQHQSVVGEKPAKGWQCRWGKERERERRKLSDLD